MTKYAKKELKMKAAVVRFNKPENTEEDGEQLFLAFLMTEQEEMAFKYTVKDSDYQEMEGRIF